ncbi:HU family DNA-binding protein [Candidatus Margulisiibacteriota bacterium]
MNKKELVNIISEKTGKSKSEILDIIELMLEKITDALVAGEKVRLVGFGVFEVRKRAAREGRNPQTGDRIHIAETKSPSFLAGKALKDAVKGRSSEQKLPPPKAEA